ncbi:MAG: TM2 domain-containing protein [Ottowia sp.]|nr:TM2 domain-containing protein [Ottowia sp.]
MTSSHHSKTLAAILAALFGSFGLHRFYLYGWRDRYAWVHMPLGWAWMLGVYLLNVLTLQNVMGWVFVLGGAIGVLSGWVSALMYGLCPDVQWDTRHNPCSQKVSAHGWGAIIVVVATLFIGTTIMMAGLAIGFEQIFYAQSQEVAHLGLYGGAFV